MGASKKSRNKQNCLGRSLMHNKLKRKDYVEDAIYSKIGQYETKEVSKKISILDKEPVDDFLDNQLVINDVEVTKVFCQKKEIKEKKFNECKNENVQNIVLPIPSRAVFVKNKEKAKFILLEKENAKDKKKKKNTKKVDFLMRGKHMMPFHNCVGKKEETRKQKMKRMKKEMKRRNRKNSYRGDTDEEEEKKTENEEDVTEEDGKEKKEDLYNEESGNESEEGNNGDNNEEEEEEEEEEENEEEDIDDNDEEEEEERSVGKEEKIKNEKKKTDRGASEISEFSEKRKNNEIEKKMNESFIEETSEKTNKDSEYELKYVEMYEKIGEKYNYENIKEELDKEALDKYELEYFIEWRKLLSYVEEEEGYVVTPYEKNIEYWRQLWRVIEKSHLLFYIIDARNPLFFYCKGFEHYVKKVDPRKKIILILNKADFLSYENRKEWSDYFEKRNIKIIFFSALRELYHQNAVVFENVTGVIPPKRVTYIEEGNNYDKCNTDQIEEKENGNGRNNLDIEETDKINVVNIGFGNLSYEKKKNDNTDILSINDLIKFIKKTKEDLKHMYHDIEIETFGIPKYVVGFVGYPNVGKSSIINCIIGKKKVGVSRRPGKTKHFQTLPLKQFNFTLCDCPGLIFPSLVFSKYDLIINGVFSIDHYKGNFIEIIQILCNIMPTQLCDFYKINKNIIKEILLKKKQTENQTENQTGKQTEKQHNITYSQNSSSSSTTVINESIHGENKRLFLDATEFLQALCTSRKYISGGKGGILHLNFATRLIIHDFVTGKLIYNMLPSFSINYDDVYNQCEFIDVSRWDDKVDPIILEKKEEDSGEEVKMSKRKLRALQKKMIRNKNLIRCPVK